MIPVLVVLGILAGLPGAVATVHLGILAVGSLLFRERLPAGDVPAMRFLVVIPAHDEEQVIAETLRAVNDAKRPRDEILVVADRCGDRTAAIARSFGTQVLERGLDEEPGRAAARQAGVDWATTRLWDAMVMIDADSIVEPGFFDAAERLMSTGVLVAQARSEMVPGRSAIANASVMAFAMQGILIPRGRDRLGLHVRMRGTGMIIARTVVEQFEFRGAAGEDRWYGLDLCLAGVTTRHLDAARLRSENVHTWRAASTQKLRYEAGRMSGAQEFAGRLLRTRTRAGVEAATELVSPPFALAVLSLVVAVAILAAAGAVLPAVVALALLGSLAMVLVLALAQAGAGPRTWLSLATAPWYIAWKVVVQVRAIASVHRREPYYPPTARK